MKTRKLICTILTLALCFSGLFSFARAEELNTQQADLKSPEICVVDVSDQILGYARVPITYNNKLTRAINGSAELTLTSTQAILK